MHIPKQLENAGFNNNKKLKTGSQYIFNLAELQLLKYIILSTKPKYRIYVSINSEI